MDRAGREILSSTDGLGPRTKAIVGPRPIPGAATPRAPTAHSAQHPPPRGAPISLSAGRRFLCERGAGPLGGRGDGARGRRRARRTALRPRTRRAPEPARTPGTLCPGAPVSPEAGPLRCDPALTHIATSHLNFRSGTGASCACARRAWSSRRSRSWRSTRRVRASLPIPHARRAPRGERKTLAPAALAPKEPGRAHKGAAAREGGRLTPGASARVRGWLRDRTVTPRAGHLVR